MFQKNNNAIGNVEKELKFNSFGFGERRWMWKRRYFSGFSIDAKRMINQHIMIVGSSGGGKSNACKTIVGSLCSDGANVAILDPHSEYVEISKGISAEIYDASRNGINMFELDGMSEREKTSEITGMLKRNFRLGEVQSYMLYKCIAYTYRIAAENCRTPNIHDLIFSVKIFIKNSRSAAEKNILYALERRLSLIDNGAFQKSAEMEKVAECNSIFLLSNLHTPESQSIYIEGFLRKVYSHMLLHGKDRHRTFYIVIDEAEKLGDNPIIGRLAAEGRKYGIGIIAISQRAKEIDRELRGNAAMLVSFGMREPEELNYISNFIAGGNESSRYIEVKKALRNLGRGRAIVLNSQHPNPYLVRFLHAKGAANIEYMVSELARGGISERGLLEKAGEEENAVRDAIQNLLSSGKIRKHGVLCGGFSGTWYISDAHNSPEHDIAIGIISKKLKSQGIRNRIYNSSFGPDIIAYRGERQIAVEYETGSKKIEESMAMIAKRGEKYGRVIVIVNDDVYKDYSERMCNVFRFSSVDNIDFAGELDGKVKAGV